MRLRIRSSRWPRRSGSWRCAPVRSPYARWLAANARNVRGCRSRLRLVLRSGLRLAAVSGLGRGGLLEVLADQLALLGHKLVEVLIDVPFADRFRGQVEILDLLELARLSVRG